MKVCVFVASHINYDGQNDLLKECLSSLINQTKKPDIFVSISFSEKKYRLEFVHKILSNFLKYVNFLYSDDHLYQMEHLHKLTEKFANKYDLIMFCDDDDTYASDRVETFMYAHENGLSNSKDFILGGVKEIMDSNHPLVSPEFWCYGLKPEILIEFFKRFSSNGKIDLLKHIFSDMYLRAYLACINKNDEKFGFIAIAIDEPGETLYRYNKLNPNSICETLLNRETNEIENNNILLMTLHCLTLTDFNKRMDELEERHQHKIDKMTKEEMISIHNFCVNILYI